MHEGITATENQLCLVESRDAGYLLSDMKTFVESHIGRGKKIYAQLHIESHDQVEQLTLPHISRILTVNDGIRSASQLCDVTILVPHLNMLDYRQNNWAFVFYQSLASMHHINRMIIQFGTHNVSYQFPVFKATYRSIVEELFPDKVERADQPPELAVTAEASTRTPPAPMERIRVAPNPYVREEGHFRRRRGHRRANSLDSHVRTDTPRAYFRLEREEPRRTQQRGPASEFFYNRFMPGLDHAARKSGQFLSHLNPFMWCALDPEPSNRRRRRN